MEEVAATELSVDPLNIANLVSNYFNNCQKVLETKENILEAQQPH